MDCNGPYVSHACKPKLDNLLSDQPSNVAQSYYSQQLHGVTLKMFLERGGVISKICIHGHLQLLNN